jgi:hypothetical protein
VAKRDEMIRDAVAAGDRDPRVPPIHSIPSCYVFAEVVDVSVRGPCWYNAAYCTYYGLKSIRPATPESTAQAAIHEPAAK